MTESIVEVGSKHVNDVQEINQNLIEKTLRMRCLAYLSQVKSQLLVETIYDMNNSRQEMADLSDNLSQYAQKVEQQKRIIEEQRQQLATQNQLLRSEKGVLELEVEEYADAERQAREIISRTQKMDSIGEITSGIAHDFNNMISIINGYAAILEGALSAQPTLAKYAREIYHAGSRGAVLTRKLLDFSKKTPSEASALDINSLLLDIKQMLEKTFTSRIQLVLDLDDSLWTTWVDSGDLEDAIVNLSINAMHAISANGKVTIKTRNKTLGQLDSQVLQLNTGDYVVLSISDTGVGMDEATRERIFEPFYSTKGEKGTGLGLSQTYGLIKRSKGAIKVYSEPGEGSCFSLYFPRYQEDAEQHKIDEADNIQDFSGHEKILVVDDEPALRDLCRLILEERGYQVSTAENSKKALEILESESIDLLLSDIIMPEVDGYQLAAIVQQKYPNIKIQLASGFSDDRHKRMGDENLSNNLISKPYQADALLNKVRTLLDEK